MKVKMRLEDEYIRVDYIAVVKHDGNEAQAWASAKELAKATGKEYSVRVVQGTPIIYERLPDEN